MIKKVALVLLIPIIGSTLSCFCGKEDLSYEKFILPINKAFSATNDISSTDSTLKIDVKEKMAMEKPIFTQQTRFDENIEVDIIDIRIVNAKSSRVRPAPYGWAYSRHIKEEGIEKNEDIIIDRDSYFKNSGIPQLFDSKNMLGYSASGNTLTCSKLGKEEDNLLWSVEFNEAKLCSTPFDNNVIIYNTNEVALIDIEELAISRYFVLNKSMRIESIIPSGTNLWIFAIDKKELLSRKPYNYLKRNAYCINSKNEINKFQMPFMYVKEKDEEMMFGSDRAFYIVDKNLDTKQVDLYGLHSDLYPVENTTAYKFIVGEFEIGKSSERYFVDLKNPETLLKKPAELITLNLFEGAKRDYCYRVGSVCYGYNIKNQEITWEIDVSDVPADIVPIYSTQNGILFSGIDSYSKNKIIRAYGKKWFK